MNWTYVQSTHTVAVSRCKGGGVSSANEDGEEKMELHFGRRFLEALCRSVALKWFVFSRVIDCFIYSRASIRWINRNFAMIAAGLTNYPTSGQFWQKLRRLLHSVWSTGAIYESNQSWRAEGWSRGLSVILYQRRKKIVHVHWIAYFMSG